MKFVKGGLFIFVRCWGLSGSCSGRNRLSSEDI